MGWLIALGILILLGSVPLGVFVRYDSGGPLVRIVAGVLRFTVIHCQRRKRRSQRRRKSHPRRKKKRRPPSRRKSQKKRAEACGISIL